MVEAPDDAPLQSFDAQVVVSDPSTTRDGFAVEVFDGANFDPEDVRDIEELYDDAIDSVTGQMRPYYFAEGDVVGYAGFDTMARRGWTVTRSTSRPGQEVLTGRTSDENGNLAIQVSDGWTASTPWLAKQLEPGDLLDAVVAGQVVEQRPEGTVYGFEPGRFYLMRPEGPTGSAFVYRWDRDREEIEPRDADGNEYISATSVCAVYREPIDDPILGFKPGTDTGLWSWDPFFVSDLPVGYDLDPYIPSQDGLSELLDTDIYIRSGGVVYSGTPFQETPDGAGISITTDAGLSYDYYTPTSTQSSRNEVELVAVPAEDPVDTDTTGGNEGGGGGTGTGTIDTGDELEQRSMSGSTPATELQSLYDEAPFSREEAVGTFENTGLPVELEDLDGIGAARADTLRDAGILTTADLGMLVVGSGDDSALPPDESTLPPLTGALDDFRGRGKSAVLNAGADMRETVLEGMATSREGSLPIGSAIPDDRPDQPSFPVTVDAIYDGPEDGASSDVGVIEFEGGDLSRVNAEVVESARETLELVFPPGTASAGERVAVVTFMDPDCYEIDKEVDSLGLRSIEEYEGPVEVGRDRVPGNQPLFVASGPDGTAYIAIDGRVYGYPSDVDASLSGISIDRQRGERLGVPADALEEKVEQEEGWTYEWRSAIHEVDGEEADGAEANGSGGGGLEVSDEPDSDSPEGESDLYRGLTPTELQRELDRVFPKARAGIESAGGELILSWEADSEHEEDFSRDSAAVPADSDSIEENLSTLVGVYDDAVTLDDDEAAELAEQRSDSPLEIPSVVESSSSESGSEQGAQESRGGTGVENPSPLSTETISQAQAILENPRAVLDGSPNKEEIGLAVARALEPEFLDAIGGVDGDLIVTPIFDQVPDPDGGGGVTTQLTRFKIAFQASPSESGRLAGAGLYNSGEPVILETQGVVDAVGRTVDGLVDVVQYHDRENSQYRDLQARVDELAEVTENDIKNGNVDFQRLVLTAEQARMVGRSSPKFFEDQFLNAQEKISLAIKYAQLAVGILDGSTTMGKLLDRLEAGVTAGNSRDLAIQELRDRMSDGAFAPGQYIRDYFRVPVGARDPGDIVEETESKREEARRDATMTDLEQQLGMQGPFTIEVVKQESLNRRGLGARVRGADTGLLVGDTLTIEEVLFQTAVDVDASEYAEGDIVAEATTDGQDVDRLDIKPAGAGESEPKPESEPSPPAEDGDGGDDFGPGEGPSLDVDPDSPLASNGPSPEEPTSPPSDPGVSADTSGIELGGEAGGGSGSGSEVSGLDPETVVVEELNIETVETGDVDLNVYDSDAVDSIRDDIEDRMG